MPTDAECLAFWEEELATGIGAWEYPEEAVEKRGVGERWPDRAEQMAYFDWSRNRANAPYEHKIDVVDVMTRITGVLSSYLYCQYMCQCAGAGQCSGSDDTTTE
ncbi:MAG: hypothetical protein M1839_008312 [Geoglossum umbratile]|nr:MAG: hypothetical protein M1839_008312 [Geoglossum umbratile]